MSALLQNKQIAHVATEIVVLLGITFYFSSKNKKLLEHIEDLSQRLEDQEDSIQKHDQIIKQLVQIVNNINVQPKHRAPMTSSQENHPQFHGSKSVDKKSLHVKQKKKIKSPPKIYEENEEIDNELHIQQNEVNKIELLSEDDNESALDDELAEELQDLDNEQVNNSLKKE
jgi:hypothetical protein